MPDKLTPQSEDFNKWYNDLVVMSGLADYAPVRGCMVVRPYGTALWENITQALDKRFKATGHQNALFPSLIPMSFLEKERHHVEGFSPELAVVTYGGGEKLEEPLVVRPTSETIIGHMMAQWIHSWRDLPLLLNQWCDVVRWEMRTKLFIRTLNFYWQEGHTAHATSEDAMEETQRMLDVYYDFAVDDAAVAVMPGRKSESEKFAGAEASFSLEGMMGDKKALQAATSHFLGQNFAKAFDIKYLDKDNSLKHCWTTSWGLSTRFIGAIIMTHGDDNGLVLPPKLAPIQVVIVPIYKNDEEKSKVMEAATHVKTTLQDGVRTKLDDRDEVSPGFKFNDWELRGVPLRIEIGPKDVDKHQVVFARRDLPGKTGKSFVSQDGLAENVTEMLGTIQAELHRRSLQFRQENTQWPKTYDEFRQVVEDGWALAWWCGERECEAQIKEETKATTRNIPTEQSGGEGVCIHCGKPAQAKAIFARAY
jgi:prolyl-tRNA synthetase